MKYFTVLVCGGRDVGDLENYIKYAGHPLIPQKTAEYNFIKNKIHALAKEWPKPVMIIAGAAKGVDSVAADWAIVTYTKLKEFPADWKTHGKAAGPIRNKQMLVDGNPDLVVAFPGENGTANMIRQSKDRAAIHGGPAIIEVSKTELDDFVRNELAKGTT